MMSRKDPYQILGVSKSAKQDEIKNAYRALAKKYHPDLNPGNKEAENKFKEITHAYDLIGTPEARAKFDRGEFDESMAGGARRQGPFYYQTQGGPGEGRYTYSFGSGFDEDIFDSIFGGFGTGRGARSRAKRGTEGFQFPGEDQHYQMDIDLRDAVLGAQREITLPTGKRISVKIPPGIAHGSKLRFSGLGGPGVNGGPPGDAYVEIRIRDDARFKREGSNLLFELPVSLTEAVFGAKLRVPTIEGQVELKIPKHSNTGTKLKLSGKGVVDRETGRRGDQIVVLKVVLPEKIDSELEDALRNWQAKHSYNPRERGAA